MSMQTNQPVQRRKSGGVNLQTIIGVLAGLYGVSPIDVVPDFLPVVGQADDAMVIVLALVLMIVVTMSDRGDGGGQ